MVKKDLLTQLEQNIGRTKAATNIALALWRLKERGNPAAARNRLWFQLDVIKNLAVE